MDLGERYVLGRLVGEGATAQVYEAEDTVLRREVAVKLFRYPDVGDTRSERIGEETRILASLAHPHVLPIYDSGRSAEGHRFIVMPLIRGTTLAKVVARGPVPPREVKRIGRALAQALSHVHAAGIVHRDVKPSNVLLAEDGTPYLADFGFAHSDDSPALTSTDCIVGTAGYLAPEQAEGLSVTPAVDVYALGLVLLEALTGERAYRGTPLERATANALRPPDVPARLGPGWLRVLRTMTAKNPAARPTAVEAGALVSVVEDELPEVAVSDDTMELTSVDGWSRFPSGVSEPVASAPPYSAASIGSSAGAGQLRPARPGRRVAAFGAAAAVAVAVVGLGADWLASGASADTRAPVTTVPGAGAAASPQVTTPSRTAVAVVPAGAAAKPTSSTSSTSSPSTAPTIDRAVGTGAPTQPKRCQGGGGQDWQDGQGGPDGQDGPGHGKHKCPGH